MAGILGPSTVCAWRPLSSRLERAGNGFDVDLVEMARLLGLGTGAGRNSPMWRTLERATRFEIAQWRADKTVLAVRLRIPSLPRRHVLRLPLVAQQAHEAWLTASNRRPGQNPGPRHWRGDEKERGVSVLISGPAQRERAALALALGAAEPPLRQDWPQWTTPEARRHFAFLEAQGYPISPAERLESSTARPPGRRP